MQNLSREEFERRFMEQQQMRALAKQSEGQQPVKASEVKGYLIAILAEIIGMMTIGKMNGYVLMILIGAMMMTVWALMKSKGTIYGEAPVAVIPLFGISFIVLPAAMLIGDLITGGMDERIKTLMGCLLMAVISVGSFLVLNSNEKRLKYQCSAVVMAKCIYIDSKLSHRGSSPGARVRRIYAPMWEYEIHGQLFHKQEHSYTSNLKVNVGDVCEVYVDPNEPMTLYRPGAFSMKFVGAVCGLLTLSSIAGAVIAFIR